MRGMSTSNDRRTTDDQRSHHTVVMVLFDGIAALDATGPLDVLAAANHYGGRYRIVTVSPGGKQIGTTSGLGLAVDMPLEEFTGRVGTLVVPGRPDWWAAVSDRDLVGH